MLAGSSVRENSLVPVKMRSFTAIVSIWRSLGFKLLALSWLGRIGPSKLEVRRILCYLTAGNIKLGKEPPSLYCCPPLESVPPTTPLIDKTTLPCFNALPPYPLWPGDMHTTLQNFVTQHKKRLERLKKPSGLVGFPKFFDASPFKLERNFILRIKSW